MLPCERDTLFIDGEWHTPRSNRRMDVLSPFTEQVVGHVPLADAKDVDLAIRTARVAFDDGRWSGLTPDARAEILGRAVTLLHERGSTLAAVVTTELGKPITASLFGVERSVATARYFIGLGRDTRTAEMRVGGLGSAMVLREPVGVVAAIAPWNGPLGMAITKIIPALAAGCTVVFKPAPETPLSIYLLAEAFQEAGLPRGVFNLVMGAAETGAALVAHPLIDMVTFTGSTAAGHRIGEVCGRNFKRMQLELGGKSAAIVLEDADIDLVAPALGGGCFDNTGQVCIAFSRVLVQRARYSEVVDAVVGAARAHVLGDPFDPVTTMGPLVSAQHLARVQSMIESGRVEGARVVTGGGRPEGIDQGYFIEPTVFVDANNEMRIAREEIFGPVTAVIPFDTVEEAIGLANDSDFGLHGGVFSRDPHWAVDVARRVRSGTFTINGFRYNSEAPFGGVKDSGVGRDTGQEGFDSFLELKTVNIPTGFDRHF